MTNIGINELARRLGVAKSTVSKALSGHPDISAPTRTRITAAAARYNYNPSWIARALTSKKTALIGLVMHRPQSGFFIEIAESVVVGAGRRGYRVALDFSGDDPELEKEILADYRGRHLEGAIIEPSLKDTAVALANSCGDMPYVIVDHYLNGTKVPYVGSDFHEIGYLAARHLLELGHRRIGYLGGSPGFLASRARQAGFLKACREFGAPIGKDWICHESFDESAGYRQALAVMRKFPEVTAFACAGDALSQGALRAARTLGKSAPRDISVVGVSALGNISSISQCPKTIGEIALDTLLRKISGLPVKTRRIVGAKIDARGTTAPPL
ncbi:MAG: LacI family DNA-binding transcriptional regulator [Kiritimatiellaeota bacterium]|nr:LacI family DNA-binding transcriptional regulator [Kiritimatiellota bacterium]